MEAAKLEIETVLAISEAEDFPVSEMRDWLIENGVFQDGMEDAHVERRYKVFHAVEFGEYAFKSKSSLFQDMVHLEKNCAAYQDDIGCVNDWPFSMEVKRGALIRQRPI